MSILNKILKTIKDSTGIDATTLTDKAQSLAGYANLSTKAKGLSQLSWKWSEDAMMIDKGTGKPLRNWDRQTKLDPRLDDIFLSWEKQSIDFDEYLIFIGWQGWPYAIIEKDHPEGVFLPEYVENLANNNFNSVKHCSIKASETPVNCIKFPASKTSNEFYYIKLIGKTSDEKYYDIKGCTFASAFRREKEGYSPVPEGLIPEIIVPNGGREKNPLENELTQKAKKNKRR